MARKKRGKVRNFHKSVDRVIKDAEILLLLIDSRFVKQTRNIEIERLVRFHAKPLIYVFSKCDLVAKKDIEKWKREFKPSVFISARSHLGKKKLRERILILAEQNYGTGTVTVGVLGYPNVGKSSLINMLKGRKSASTSKLSGHTKSLQLVRADERIMLIDTPGVIPFGSQGSIDNVLSGSIDYTKIKDPVTIVVRIMRKYPKCIGKYFEVKEKENEEETLDEIAIKKHIFLKGGLPDAKRLALMIIRDVQKGKIRIE